LHLIFNRLQGTQLKGCRIGGRRELLLEAR
jgi:hypothetical protein